MRFSIEIRFFESDLRFVVYVMFEFGGSEMDSVVAVLSEYEDNVRWISKHYDELKKRFKDEWIAVLNKTVIDHDRQLVRLVERLRRKYSEAYNEIAVDYVTVKEIELIL